MTAADEPAPRIEMLDIVRGVAVMGILAMNIVAFAMPPAAYLNPTAYGTQGPGDTISWVFSFLFIDGRMVPLDTKHTTLYETFKGKPLTP